MISKTNQLELRHFLYFLVLSETLHYREAAERLHISQSALSQQIMRLETIVGEVLFIRSNRKVMLSEAGFLLKEEARLIINQLEHSMERWRYKMEGGEGIIRIGFVASAMQVFLPKVINKFARKHPKIKFYLQELSNKDQLTALENKELDIGFVRTRLTAASLTRMSVFKENLTLVLPESHPLNTHNFKNIGQLRDESFILFPNDISQMYYDQVINLCKEYDFEPQIKHRSMHGPTIFKLVENGHGISVVPTSLKDVHNYKVKFIELKKIHQKTELFAVWNNLTINLAKSRFLEVLSSVKK